MIAMYLRLSLSDGDLGENDKNESNSIENQRLLLKNYIDDNEDLIDEVVEYVDDGYTGTNFDRPGFKRMIEDCRKGIISTIVVKDLSRFGRNYVEVGDYIEQLFPLLGIRFIAVNHSYDSDDYKGQPMGFDMEINNIISSLYSRDLSKKRKSTARLKWKNGYSTSGCAPFGYIKNKSTKGKYVIDPEAAKIVKIIFDKAAKGYTTTEIARYLNENKIPTRQQYHKAKGSWIGKNVCSVNKSEQLWLSTMVANILGRYEYTGALVAGRSSPVKVGSSHLRKNDKNDWIIVENMWEPIVSKRKFEKANEIVKRSKKARYITERNHLLKGKVKCGTCNLTLAYDDQTIEPTYICRHGQNIGDLSKCCKEKYNASELERKVFYTLKNMLRILYNKGTVVIEKQKESIKVYREEDIRKIEQEIKLLKAKKITDYELYAEGHMSKELFIYKKEELIKEINDLVIKKNKLETQVADSALAFESKKEIVDQAGDFLKENDLTKEMVDAFIEKVYVYDKENIRIIFKNTDLIKSIVDENLTINQ